MASTGAVAPWPGVRELHVEGGERAAGENSGCGGAGSAPTREEGSFLSPGPLSTYKNPVMKKRGTGRS